MDRRHADAGFTVAVMPTASIKPLAESLTKSNTGLPRIGVGHGPTIAGSSTIGRQRILRGVRGQSGKSMCGGIQTSVSGKAWTLQTSSWVAHRTIVPMTVQKGSIEFLE